MSHTNKNRTELCPEVLGVAGVNSFVGYCSSPRMVMDFSHISSRVNLIDPDKKQLVTGVENELGKYINDVRTEKDVVVKAMVPRNRELGPLNPETTLIVEYEEDGELWLDLIEVVNHRSTNMFHGYMMEPTPELENIHYNSALPKGTVLGKTASLADDGDYKFGVMANTVMISHPSVAEDGIVVREGFLDKMKFTTITKRVINLTKDNIPINLYGDENNFKMIPNIGEPVRPDGLLCAVRERSDWFSIADLNNESLAEVDHTFDTPWYVPSDSIVVDVKVFRGNYNKSEYTENMTSQLDDYAFQYTNYSDTLVKQYEGVINDLKMRYTDKVTVRQTPRLRRRIADAMITRDMVTARNKYCYRRVNIEQYRVEVTCMSVVRPNLGYKLTDLYGAKGVICRILPDEHMPRDKNGVVADIITDANSSIHRMNTGRVYEQYLGALLEETKTKLLNNLIKEHGAFHPDCLTDKNVSEISSYLRGLYSYINSEMVEFIDGLNPDELRQHLIESLTDKIYLYYPPDNENNAIDIISAIENSQYKPIFDKVTYVDERGERITTVDNVRIGSMYYLVLDKVTNNYSAVSSAKVNGFNFPIKGGGADRFKYPHSLTPTTTLSETEVRILSSYAEPKLIGELIDLALNPTSHKLLIKNILESDEAFSTNFDIDREIDDYGQTKSLQLLRHISNAAGFDFVYKEQQ